ncbi:hypothetical protein Droror1_Dr00024936 [Drosera rotundifolia]
MESELLESDSGTERVLTFSTTKVPLPSLAALPHRFPRITGFIISAKARLACSIVANLTNANPLFLLVTGSLSNLTSTTSPSFSKVFLKSSSSTSRSNPPTKTSTTELVDDS